MNHALKTWPEYFRAIANGSKTFEIRKADRPFAVGDTLVLREFDPETGEYTEFVLCRTITYILNGGQFGIESGYVVLGLTEDYDFFKLTPLNL